MNTSYTKVLGSLLKLFPFFHLILIFISLLGIISFQDASSVLIFIFVIYFLPLILWHILFITVVEGKQQIGPHAQKGSTWLISHYLQYNFFTFPVLERVLIVIPGAYSLWLRLWGSQIGKKIVWTPNMIIYDRSLINIGDYSIIGDHTLIGAHILKRQNKQVVVLVKKVSIGSHVVIGAKSNIGPGANIPDHAFLPAQSSALLGRIERRE